MFEKPGKNSYNYMYNPNKYFVIITADDLFIYMYMYYI